MDPINGLEDLGALGLAAQAAPPPRDELGQEAFLELMIAQFRNQDPMQPMTNGEFLGQLAQFGTVSGIQELQSAFSGLSESIYSDQALQAANLVGHKVLARSEFGALGEDSPLEGAVDLEGSVGAFDIEITDPAGQLVHTISLGPQQAGLVEFSWDGRTLEGETAAPGVYHVAARVTRGNQFESLSTLIATEIESVTLGRNSRGLTLNTAGHGALPFNQIERIL